MIQHPMKALFASGIILFVEKLILQFVAINFHEKALAERIAENHMGLRALDHLSDAPITPTTKATPRKLEGMKSSTPFYSNAGRIEKEAGLVTEIFPVKEEDNSNVKNDQSSSSIPSPQQKRKKRKNVTSVIVDQVGWPFSHFDWTRSDSDLFQVGDAIGRVALKHSKSHHHVDSTGVYSARKLAKKLFSVLNVSNPPRSHLLEEDFYPYFRSTSEAVSL